MKSKFLKGLILFFTINFILSFSMFGILSNEAPDLRERLMVGFTSFLNPSLLFFNIFFLFQLHPFACFGFIIFLVIAYYVYSNYFLNNRAKSLEAVDLTENQPISNDANAVVYGNNQIQFINQQEGQNNNFGSLNSVAFKKLFLILTLSWFIFLFILLNIPDKQGGWGVGVGMMLIGPVIISYVIYPIYFIILALKYSREKGSMHILDKVMFYILLVPIAIMGTFAIYKVYSGNLIREAFINNSNNKKVVEKQAGPADLVIKDIYANFEMATIKFCNESENATVKKVSIKIETDKNFSRIIDNYPSLSPGECQIAQMFHNPFELKRGESVKITVTLDPKNKISEINKENNKMTKDLNL